MPGRPVDLSYPDVLAKSFLDDFDDVTEHLAAEQGPPTGTAHLSETEMLRAWGLRDPHVDRDEMIGYLTSTGIPPQYVDALEVLKDNDDLAELKQAYLQPQSPETAELLADVALYPARLGLWRFYADPEQQVQFATGMDRKWRAQREQAISAYQPASLPGPPIQAPGAPAPPPAPPAAPAGPALGVPPGPPAIPPPPGLSPTAMPPGAAPGLPPGISGTPISSVGG